MEPPRLRIMLKRADADPASFLEPPGFLLHHWRDQGGMLTHSVPIGDFSGPFPFA